MENGYLRCSCKHCGGSVEFSEEGLGVEVECPHCTLSFVLFQQVDEPGTMKSGTHLQKGPPPLPPLPSQAHSSQRTVPCKTCNTAVSPTAPTCPNCGERFPGAD